MKTNKNHLLAPEDCEAYIPHRDIALWFSPDDNGYYWEELFGQWLSSKVFPTMAEAMAANDDEMEWS